MPLSFNAQCRVCVSPLRAGADRQLLTGAPSRKVAGWLAAKGYQVSQPAVANHRHHHLPVAQDAKARLQDPRAPLTTSHPQVTGDPQLAVQYEAAVGKVLDAVVLLSQIARQAMEVCRELYTVIMSALRTGGKITWAMVRLWESSAREVIRCTVAVHRILEARKARAGVHLNGLPEGVAEILRSPLPAPMVGRAGRAGPGQFPA